MFINPTTQQQKDFMSMPDVKPVFMINLLKFKPKGVEVYQEYIKKVAPLLRAVGGELIWSGKPMSILIGPENEGLWDAMLIVRYPDKMALAQLGGNPEYPGHLRADALEDSRLIACAELDLSQS